jgi:hypothetical protein
MMTPTVGGIRNCKADAVDKLEMPDWRAFSVGVLSPFSWALRAGETGMIGVLIAQALSMICCP